MSEEAKPYVRDAAARRRWEAAMARIEAQQAAAGFPTCALCGQRTRRLDRYGLCPKVSVPHEEWRAQARVEAREARI